MFKWARQSQTGRRLTYRRPHYAEFQISGSAIYALASKTNRVKWLRRGAGNTTARKQPPALAACDHESCISRFAIQVKPGPAIEDYFDGRRTQTNRYSARRSTNVASASGFHGYHWRPDRSGDSRRSSASSPIASRRFGIKGRT